MVKRKPIDLWKRDKTDAGIKFAFEFDMAATAATSQRNLKHPSTYRMEIEPPLRLIVVNRSSALTSNPVIIPIKAVRVKVS